MESYGLGLLRQYPEAWKVFLLFFVLTNIFTGLFYVLAKKKNLMPAIRARDVHTERKPRVGGIGMWVAATLGGAAIAITRPEWFRFTEGGSLPSPVLWGILAGLIVILVFGALDDIFSLKPGWQLLGQFIAATCLIASGLEVPYLRLPFEQVIWMDQIHWNLFGLTVAPLSALFVYLWIIIMINVMNFFDGLDGLAGSVAMTASVVLLLVSLRLGFVGAATLCLALFGVTAGFLPWNWNPSKLFMGTVGSQFLGFLLGVVAVISGAKVATAILVLGIPVFDAFIVIVRRLLAHEKPWQADQRHLHHRLLKIGLKVPQVVLLINAVAVTFGVLALNSQKSEQKGLLTLALLFCIVTFLVITYLLERRVRRT